MWPDKEVSEGAAERYRFRSLTLGWWREQPDDPSAEPVWRFALLEIGQRRLGYGFSGLDELCAFLRHELAADPPAEPRRLRA